MIPAPIWNALRSRLAGPVASAAAVVFAGLWLATAAGRAAETAKVARLTVERDAWKAAAAGWQGSFAEAERLRQGERQRATAALARAEKSCAAQVAQARRSATAIQHIVTETVDHDANGCLARRLVPAERLRDALAPGA